MKKIVLLLSLMLGGVLGAQAQERVAAQGQSGVEKVNQYLDDAGVFFLASTQGKQPHLRPLGMHFVMDGKLWFGVGDFKQVYKQLKKNPRVEIVALKKDNHWLRYTGRVVFAKDPKYKQKALEMFAYLRGIYNEKTGHKVMLFYLEDATAVDMDMMGETERLL
jgi:uncharacterized pyridoxamine 5'-phosphate oxidase family protein